MSINWANQSPLLAFSATDQSGVGHLYQLNMNNGISTLLSTGTQTGERVENFDWSANDNYLGYTSTQGLHLVTPAAPSPQLIHDISVGSMESYGLSWPWSHHGDRLAYSVGNNAGNTSSLSVYRLATPDQPVEVAGPFARGTFISRPVWSRDNARLAFKTFQAGCSFELFTTSSTEHNVIFIPDDECQSNFVY